MVDSMTVTQADMGCSQSCLPQRKIDSDAGQGGTNFRCPSLGMSLLHTLDIFQVWYIIFTTWRCMIPRLFTQCIALQWDHVGRSGHVICPVKAYDERTKTGEHRWPYTWLVHPMGLSICSYMKMTLIYLLVCIGTICDWSNDNETYV